MKIISIRLNEVQEGYIKDLEKILEKEQIGEISTSRIIKICIFREWLRQQKN